MTPMIDIIFLLLVFFILTTKFIPEEKVIANLLPTDKGQSSASTPEVVETEEINIKIIPGIFQSRLAKSFAVRCGSGMRPITWVLPSIRSVTRTRSSLRAKIFSTEGW